MECKERNSYARNAKCFKDFLEQLIETLKG